MLLPCVFGFGDYGLRLMLLPLIVMADVISINKKFPLIKFKGRTFSQTSSESYEYIHFLQS